MVAELNEMAVSAAMRVATRAAQAVDV